MNESKFLKTILKGKKSFTIKILVTFLITGNIGYGVEVDNSNTTSTTKQLLSSLTEIRTSVISKVNYTQIQDIDTGIYYDLSNLTDNMKVEMLNFQINSGSLSIGNQNKKYDLEFIGIEGLNNKNQVRFDPISLVDCSTRQGKKTFELYGNNLKLAFVENSFANRAYLILNEGKRTGNNILHINADNMLELTFDATNIKEKAFAVYSLGDGYNDPDKNLVNLNGKDILIQVLNARAEVKGLYAGEYGQIRINNTNNLGEHLLIDITSKNNTQQINGAVGIQVDAGANIDIKSKNNIIKVESELNAVGILGSGLNSNINLKGESTVIDILDKNSTASVSKAVGIEAIEKTNISIENTKTISIISEANQHSAYGIKADKEGKVDLKAQTISIKTSSNNPHYRASTGIYTDNNGFVNLKGGVIIKDNKPHTDYHFAIYNKKGIIQINNELEDVPIDITGHIVTSEKGKTTINFKGSNSIFIGQKTTSTKGESNLSFLDGSLWKNKYDSQVTNLTLKNSIIDMSQDGKQTLTIENMSGNNGRLIMDISGNNLETDFLQLNSADKKQNHILDVSDKSIPLLNSYNFNNGAIHFANDKSGKITFEGGNISNISNIFNYNIKIENGTNGNKEDWFVTGIEKTEIGETTKTIIDSAAFLYSSAISRSELDSIHKRLGEIRSYEKENGIWLRLKSGEIEYEKNSINKFKNNYNMLQVGYDKKYNLTENKMFTGFAISKREDDVKFNTAGKGDSENIGLSLYTSYLNEDNYYIDLVGKISYLDMKYNTYTLHKNNILESKGKYNTWTKALSLEIGKRYEFNSYFFTPNFQLNYTYIDNLEYITNGGIKVTQDNIHSLIGKSGIKLGKQFKRSSHFIKLDFLGELNGDYKISAKGNDTTYLKEVNGNDSWLEVGVGGDFKVNENTNVYYELVKTFESDYETNWEGGIGFRINF